MATKLPLRTDKQRVPGKTVMSVYISVELQAAMKAVRTKYSVSWSVVAAEAFQAVVDLAHKQDEAEDDSP